jgi:MmyB-like transcription regulator ligand binding domain
VLANEALSLLTDGVAPDLLEPPVNALRATLHPRGLAPRIVNFGEWSAHVLHRVRRQITLTGDAELATLYDELAAYPEVVTGSPPPETIAFTDIVLPVTVLVGGRELSFFSTMTTFGSPVDITLAELALEAFYPANRETAVALRAS